MSAAAFTQAEKAWLKALGSVLMACPSKRLGAFTTGEPRLMVYDKDVHAAWQAENPHLIYDADREHALAGSHLGRIEFPFQIDSCAG